MSVNWCTSCKCVLANEEVVNGVCERCGSEVVHKVKSQWMLKITEYAQRLIDDLDVLDYIERVKLQQKNWIGRPPALRSNSTPPQGTCLKYIPPVPTPFSAPLIWLSAPSTPLWKNGLKALKISTKSEPTAPRRQKIRL